MQRTKGSGATPGSGSLWVAEGRRLPGTGGQGEPGRALRQLAVAERDQDRKAVQPRPVQIAERCRELGIVVLRSRRLQDGRRTPPW
jgi:hypothetical protein